MHQPQIHLLLISHSNFRDWLSTARDIHQLVHQVLLRLRLHQQLLLQLLTEIKMLELPVIKRTFCQLMSMAVVDQQIFLRATQTTTVEFQKVNNVTNTQIDLNMEAVYKT